MRISLTIARMNPPTKGHLYLLSKVLKEKADRYILVLQGGNLQDKAFKNVFSQAIKEEIIKASDLKGISKLEIVSGLMPHIPTIIESLGLDKETTEVVATFGEEDIDKYRHQILEYPKMKLDGVIMKADTDNRISGTQVRNSIFENNFEEFMAQTGLEIEMFTKLRKEVLTNLENRFKGKKSQVS